MTTNIIRKVPRELIYETWGVPFDPDEELGVRILDTIDGDHGRWESYHTVIFKAPDDGLIYSADYSRGLTENQDVRPWEYDDEVTITRVESKQRVITVTDWVPVEHGTGAIPDLPRREPGAGPKIPTKEELKAQWARNRDWDDADFNMRTKFGSA
jgi:hypothetical protein